MAQKRLMQELIPLHKEKWVHIEVRCFVCRRKDLEADMVL